MKVVEVSVYGPLENFESRDVPRPSSPTGRDMVVQYGTQLRFFASFLTSLSGSRPALWIRSTPRFGLAPMTMRQVRLSSRRYHSATNWDRITTSLRRMASTSLDTMVLGLFWKSAPTANSSSPATTSRGLHPRLARAAMRSTCSSANLSALPNPSRSTLSRQRAMAWPLEPPTSSWTTDLKSSPMRKLVF